MTQYHAACPMCGLVEERSTGKPGSLIWATAPPYTTTIAWASARTKDGLLIRVYCRKCLGLKERGLKERGLEVAS